MKDDREAKIAELLLAIGHCKENAKILGYKKGHGGAGVIDCPVCQDGKLSYSVASYNGHMWGKCSTKGCVAWME